MKLQKIDLNTLEPNEIGSWPLQMRVIALAIIGIVTIAGHFFLLVNNQATELETQRSKQLSLRNEFSDKYYKAANIEAYKTQMEEMKNTLKELLRQLPTEEKVPSLMEDLSLQANAAGLEFNLIKPGKAVAKDFYTELPVKMTIIGSYHGFGRFIGGIAKLPRIVTLHDFSIKANATKGVEEHKTQGQNLIMEIDAKTYWCADRENL